MRRSGRWEDRRLSHRAARDADQAEFAAIQFGSTNVEAGTQDDRTADAMDDYEVVDPRGIEGWATSDNTYDSAASAIAGEIRRREEILKDRYPFRLEGNRVLYRQSQTLIYELCLAICQAPSVSKGEYKRLPPAFERLARDVVKSYLGQDAEGMRTGWPDDSLEPRPARFKHLMTLLNDCTREFCWAPDHGRPEDPEPRDVKDGGIDFVVWKKMPDGRRGSLFFLGQCACGDDWTQKLGDVDLSELRGWMRPVTVTEPIRAFTTPFHIPSDFHFEEVSGRAGLTLDRTRITMLAEHPNHSERIVASMPDSAADLIRLVIRDFEVGQRGTLQQQ